MLTNEAIGLLAASMLELQRAAADAHEVLRRLRGKAEIMKRLLDYDPLTREAVWFEMHDGIATLHQTQDASHIIEANKMMANEPEYSRRGMKMDWWHYARIPNIVAYKWLKEDGIDIFDRSHKQKVFAKLNDPEWKHLKVTTKRHG